MSAVRFVLLAAWVTFCGCSDRETVDANSVFGSGGASSPTFCRDYCASLVNEAPGCEEYNKNLRCEEICKYYVASVCSQPYEAFAACMREAGSGECFQPDGGKLTLVVNDCHAEYDAWLACIEDKDAGICPY